MSAYLYKNGYFSGLYGIFEILLEIAMGYLHC